MRLTRRSSQRLRARSISLRCHGCCVRSRRASSARNAIGTAWLSFIVRRFRGYAMVEYFSGCYQRRSAIL